MSSFKTKLNYKIRVLLLASVFLLSFFPSYSFAKTYNRTFQFLDRPDDTYYQLTTSITSSLYAYYQSKDHKMYSFSDLSKFVTPNVFHTVANDLWRIFTDDESFANGVLMVVHQIPYIESTDQKYPLETIVENEGDCDLFSFIAASIMKAGGLDVVLLYYEEQNHMNVGIFLSESPNDARFNVSFFLYAGKRYYIAECTGDWRDWENGWRVGESPEKFKTASAKIITLENCEEWSPAQISSSLVKSASSSVTLKLSSKFVLGESDVTLSGSISPVYENEAITIYFSPDGSSWEFLKNVTTDRNGNYRCNLTPKTFFIYYLRSGWSGNEYHMGSESPVCTLIVFPVHFLLVGIALITIILVFSLTRTKKIRSDET